jgi:FkbM family methyltransferase
MTLLLAKCVGENGTVIAFEPLPENFCVLKQNVTMNRLQNVRVEGKAVSNRSGTVALNIFDWTPFPGTSQIGSKSARAQAIVFMTHQVPAISLDHYLGNGLHIQFVKIDVEGFEDLVIEGMRETLKRDRPTLVLEHLPKRALELLREAGYGIWDLQSGTEFPLGTEPRERCLARPRML